MPQNATKCHKMPQNATKCHKMPQNATKCHKITKMSLAQDSFNRLCDGNRSLALFPWLKKSRTKMGANLFQQPLFPPKKPFVVSSRHDPLFNTFLPRVSIRCQFGVGHSYLPQ
jgi:hypothetical protein